MSRVVVAALVVATALVAFAMRRARGAGGACASSLDCAAPLVCLAGVCSGVPCGGCQAGYVCSGGACVSAMALALAAAPVAAAAAGAFVALADLANVAVADASTVISALYDDNVGVSSGVATAGALSVSSLAVPAQLVTSVHDVAANITFWLDGNNVDAAALAVDVTNVAGPLGQYFAQSPDDLALAPAALAALAVAGPAKGVDVTGFGESILNLHLSDLRYYFGAGGAGGALAACASAAASALSAFAQALEPI